MRFTGIIDAKHDAKGRVFLPASFRRQLSDDVEEFVLRRDIYQPCLVIYPLSVWDEEVQLLRKRLNRWNSHEAMVFRQFMAEAEIFTLDVSGRFLLSKRMLQFASIDKELVFVGVDDRIEIWSKDKMQEQFLSPADFGSALQELMNETNISDSKNQ